MNLPKPDRAKAREDPEAKAAAYRKEAMEHAAKARQLRARVTKEGEAEHLLRCLAAALENAAMLCEMAAERTKHESDRRGYKAEAERFAKAGAVYRGKVREIEKQQFMERAERHGGR